jgi:hypothetical protein
MSLNHPFEILKVYPNIGNVTSDEGCIKFDITSNVIWHVTSDSIWCKAADSQLGNGSFIAKFTENKGKERKALLFIKGLNLNIHLTLIQEGKK